MVDQTTRNIGLAEQLEIPFVRAYAAQAAAGLRLITGEVKKD